MAVVYGTYLINLERSPDRLEYMDTQLRALGIDYKRVNAVDGKLLTPDVKGFDARGYRLKHGRKFHPGEVGCYLSHMNALRMFLESGEDYGLILEDDCKLPQDLKTILARGFEQRADWDLLRLSTVNDGWRVPYKKLDETHDFTIALTREKGAGAYVVSRRCAEIFLEKLDPMQLAWDIAFDIEYLFGLRAVFIAPPPVDQKTGKETQIQMYTLGSKLPSTRYLTVFPYRAYLESSRFLHRGLRLLRLQARFGGRGH